MFRFLFSECVKYWVGYGLCNFLSDGNTIYHFSHDIKY